MPWMAIAAAALPIVGGIAGNAASAKDRRAARDAMNEAIGALEGVPIPDIEKQKIVLQRLEQQGLLTPEIEAQVEQARSEYENIQEDGSLRDAQTSALETLRQLGRTGLSAEDRAALNQSRIEMARDAQGRQDAILQNMAARGMGGSGSELAAALQSSQAQSDMANKQTNDIMAQAQQKALQAIMQGSNLAGSMRGQDFDIASRKASAQDAINQFNTNLSAGRMQRNTATRNDAQLQNLRETQRISDANVGLANEEEKQHKSLYQQDFENRMMKATGMYKAKTAESEMNTAEGKRKAEMYAKMGSGASDAMSGGAKGMGGMGGGK